MQKSAMSRFGQFMTSRWHHSVQHPKISYETSRVCVPVQSFLEMNIMNQNGFLSSLAALGWSDWQKVFLA